MFYCNQLTLSDSILLGNANSAISLEQKLCYYSLTIESLVKFLNFIRFYVVEEHIEWFLVRAGFAPLLQRIREVDGIDAGEFFFKKLGLLNNIHS